MDKEKVLALYDLSERIGTDEVGVRREQTPAVVRSIGLHNNLAWITYSWLTPETVERVIEDQIAYFEGLGRAFEWKVYDYDRPADLKERLAARGFQIDEPEALLVLDLREARQDLFDPPRHDIRALDTPEALDDMLRVTQQVWDQDFAWLKEEMVAVMREAPGAQRVYCAYVEGRPVSTARIRFREGAPFANLFSGSTVPEYRGQGLYHDLVAVRAQEARRRGARYLAVDASEMSRPILERLGFEALAYSTPCEWVSTPGSSPAG